MLVMIGMPNLGIGTYLTPHSGRQHGPARRRPLPLPPPLRLPGSAAPSAVGPLSPGVPSPAVFAVG
jgi:hypothetical protein